MHKFYMHWETKHFVQLILFQYMLYCGGLELNLQYFQGLPIFRKYAVVWTQRCYIEAQLC